MRPGRAADHSPPSSAAVMEEKSYTSTHHQGHSGPVTGSLYLYLFTRVNTRKPVMLFFCVTRNAGYEGRLLRNGSGVPGGGVGVFNPSPPKFRRP